MSGIKQATVRSNLSRAVQFVREGLAECRDEANLVSNVGRKDFNQAKNGVDAVRQGLHRQLPENLRQFLDGETAQWQSLLNRHDKSYGNAIASEKNASEKELQYNALRNSAEQKLSAIEQDIERLKDRISGIGGYLDRENEQALSLRREAKEILDGMRSNIILARVAQTERRNAFSKLAESTEFAKSAEREYERLINLGKDRLEVQRIKEENERQAKSLRSDIISLRRKIEQKKYQKFGNGLYNTSLQNEIETVLNLINEGNFEAAIPQAKNIKKNLNHVAETIETQEQEWKAAKLAAEKALADAKEEIASFNVDDMKKFSGSPAQDVEAAFAKVNSTVRLSAGEDFANASRCVAEALNSLRNMNEKTSENKKLSEQRNEIADSIMQALYDSDYDTPMFYLKDEGDELSDLCVVAAAPGGIGNMNLRIGLQGGVKFEVANIPEGREQLCIDSVLNMQKKLAENEINFDVTDWGRAENQNKVHLDVRQKTQEAKQTIQRQG